MPSAVNSIFEHLGLLTVTTLVRRPEISSKHRAILLYRETCMRLNFHPQVARGMVCNIDDPADAKHSFIRV